jgi:hypothetical protein
VQWLGHLLPPVPDLLQGFMCVCTQVSCSVVSNWPLCEFCGRVYCDIWSIFLIPQFCLFLRDQTMDKVPKHNSFNLIPIFISTSNTYLLKLQRLQNKFFRTIGNFPRRTPPRELNVAFKIPYVHSFVQPASRSYPKSRGWKYVQHRTGHRKYKRLKLDGGQTYGRPSDYVVVITRVKG